MAINYDIPVDFLPDDQFAKARDAALYSIAPGTKTLEAKGLDETIRKNNQDAALEALKLKETKRQADMDNTYNLAALEEKKRENSISALLKAQGMQSNNANAFSTQGERANDTKSTLMNMLSNQYRMLKDDPSNPSKTPLKDTMEWYSYVAREIAPDISEEDRQKVAYNYMSQLAARTGASMSSKQMQDFVLRYAPSLATNKQSSFSGVNFNDPNAILINSK